MWGLWAHRLAEAGRVMNGADWWKVGQQRVVDANCLQTAMKSERPPKYRSLHIITPCSISRMRRSGRDFSENQRQ